MTTHITAAICTHNRAALLPAAIERLFTQSLPSTDYEVLVIDNASTDETPNAIQRYLKQSKGVAPSQRDILHRTWFGVGGSRERWYAHARVKGTLVYVEEEL